MPSSFKNGSTINGFLLLPGKKAILVIFTSFRDRREKKEWVRMTGIFFSRLLLIFTDDYCLLNSI